MRALKEMLELFFNFESLLNSEMTIPITCYTIRSSVLKREFLKAAPLHSYSQVGYRKYFGKPIILPTDEEYIVDIIFLFTERIDSIDELEPNLRKLIRLGEQSEIAIKSFP